MLQARIARIPGITPKGVLGSSLIFGVILGDFEWSESGNWRDYDTVTGGERTQPAPGKGTKGRSLRRLNMDVLTAWGHRYPFENDRGSTGNEIRDGLAEIVRTRAAFRFVATLNTAFDSDPAELRMDATIRSLSRSTRHGEPDGRYLALEIVEYRSAETDRRSRTKTDKLPAKHKVKKGDTLRSLAKHYYKNHGELWSYIKRANGGSKGILKGYGPDDKLDKLVRGKQGTLKIPEAPTTASHGSDPIHVGSGVLG
jgi:hypothetical protein